MHALWLRRLPPYAEALARGETAHQSVPAGRCGADRALAALLDCSRAARSAVRHGGDPGRRLDRSAGVHRLRALPAGLPGRRDHRCAAADAHGDTPPSARAASCASPAARWIAFTCALAPAGERAPEPGENRTRFSAHTARLEQRAHGSGRAARRAQAHRTRCRDARATHDARRTRRIFGALRAANPDPQIGTAVRARRTSY